MIVFLDRQHAGKPYAVGDRGAWGDLDGDGRRDVEEHEALVTGLYLWHAERELLDTAVAVLPISDGTYAERHARVNRYAAILPSPSVYVAAHLNAGGGRYGSVFYDHRSALGQSLAEHVAATLMRAYEEARVAAPDVRVLAADPSAGWGRAAATIAGVFAGRAVAVCYEPAFIDCRDHRPLLTGEGPALLGRALARGLRAWAFGAERVGGGA